MFAVSSWLLINVYLEFRTAKAELERMPLVERFWLRLTLQAMILLVFIHSNLCCHLLQSCDHFFFYHDYARVYRVWFSALAPWGLVINLLFIYLFILEQEVKFTLSLTIPKKTVTQLRYCYKFKTFVLTNMGDT